MFGCHCFAWDVFWLEKDASDSPPPKKVPFFVLSCPTTQGEWGGGGLMASGKG